MAGDVTPQLEEILGEADALIRQRLEARGLGLPHLVVAVTPLGEVVLRSNVPPEVLRSFGKDLIDVADRLTGAPTPSPRRRRPARRPTRRRQG